LLYADLHVIIEALCGVSGSKEVEHCVKGGSNELEVEEDYETFEAGGLESQGGRGSIPFVGTFCHQQTAAEAVGGESISADSRQF